MNGRTQGVASLTPRDVLLACASWEDVRAQLAECPAKLKGDCFELLTEHFLRLTPEYQSQLKEVWRLAQLPRRVSARLGLPTQDEGIDLVAETHDGGFWAIQCKYRQDEEHSTTLREVATFLALRADRGFDLALLCTTADSYSGRLKKHEKLQFCAGDVWRNLDEEFFERLHHSLRGQQPQPLSPKEPRTHQWEAVAAARQYFAKGKTRGKLIMPCGTGKSLAAFWIAEALKARRVLIAVPSLALVRQTLSVWSREHLAHGRRPRWVAVCSDETVGNPRSDDPEPHLQDLGVAVETDPKSVARWLKAHKGDDLTIVFTTYQSGRMAAQAAKLAGVTFDLGVYDEAHKTAGRANSAFAHLLHDKNIKVRKRLFMTATERRYVGDSDEIVSMDDAAIYGDTVYKLTFKEALEARVLCDYQVLVVECTRAEAEKLIRDRRFVAPKGEQWDFDTEADTLAAAIALRKTMLERPVGHALSFHSSVVRARRFRELQAALTTAFSNFGPLDVLHVSGKMPTAVRSRELKAFEASGRALVTNARCLTEGVDVPAIDGILFADPRQSIIDIVQAVGRAMRPYPGKELGYVVVPVLLENGEERSSDKAFAAVLRVLKALAENDERVIDYFRTVSAGRKWSGRKPVEVDIWA
jgi:predicted helicase